MLIWGSTLPLHQKHVAEQTTGEFILSTALTTGGVLIAVMGCCGMSRRTRAAMTSSSWLLWRYRTSERRSDASKNDCNCRAQGAKNALICGVGVLFVWLVIADVIWSIFDQSVFDSFWLAFIAIWCLIFPVFLGTWLSGRNSGGPVLLDCGPHPTRVLFLVNALLFSFVGLTIGLADTSFSNRFGIAGPIFWVSFAVYWLIMATGRLQIRENGIWVYWALLQWGKIGSYLWASDSTLMVRAKGRLSSLLQGALPVPLEHKQAVDEFLVEHRPDQANAIEALCCNSSALSPPRIMATPAGRTGHWPPLAPPFICRHSSIVQEVC